MKKSLKVLSTSLLLSTLLLAGCSCNKEDEIPNVSRMENSDDLFLKVGDNAIDTYSVADIYDALIASNAGNKVIANKIIEFIANEVLDLDNPESVWVARYDAIVAEKLEELANSGSYLVKGEFSEEYMVTILRADGYSIPACTTYGTAEDLACDYTDYVNKNIKVDALSTLLKEKYIQDVTLEERASILTTKKIRNVEYFTISSSVDSTYSDFSSRDFMRNLRTKIANNEVVDFEVVEQELKAQLKEIVDKEYAKIGTSADYNKSIMADYTNKYTQDKSVGYQAKLDEIENGEYSFQKLISADSGASAVVSESITSLLLSITDVTSSAFSRNVVAVKDANDETCYYLVSANAGQVVDASDVLLSSTADSSTYTYSVVKFRVINSSTEDETDLYNAVKLLAKESTLGNGAVAYYLKENKSKISVYDDDVKAYLTSLYPDLFAE